MSLGPIEHLPACKPLLKCNTFEGSNHLEKVPPPEAAAFRDRLHLIVPGVGGCHLPRKRSPRAGGGGSRRQRAPGLAPPTQPHQHQRVSPYQAPGWLNHSSHQKEQIQPFSLNTSAPQGSGVTVTVAAREEVAPPAPRAPASKDLHSRVPSRPSVPPHRGTVGWTGAPQEPHGAWVGSFPELQAEAEPKRDRCHQGEKNPAVKTSETKKDASLGCFFSIIFFFFFMKKDHTEFSNKQNAKKIVLNKT